MPDECGSGGWQPYLMFYLANKFSFKGVPKSTYRLDFVASNIVNSRMQVRYQIVGCKTSAE